jgi:hypothetical protein
VRSGDVLEEERCAQAVVDAHGGQDVELIYKGINVTDDL